MLWHGPHRALPSPPQVSFLLACLYYPTPGTVVTAAGELSQLSRKSRAVAEKGTSEHAGFGWRAQAAPSPLLASYSSPTARTSTNGAQFLTPPVARIDPSPTSTPGTTSRSSSRMPSTPPHSRSAALSSAVE